MVGKSTPGLNALDQEREASMADEGGVSGALIENQDGLDRIEIVHQMVSCQSQGKGVRRALFLLTSISLGGLAYFAYTRYSRNSEKLISITGIQ